MSAAARPEASGPPGRARLLAPALWLLACAACIAVIARTPFTADLSAFLPRAPSAEQQVLVDQLKDGMISRLVLLGIEGADAPTRAGLSRSLAARLRADPAFAAVANGEAVHAEADRRWLFEHRYLLSPAISPEHFSVAGLHAAIGDTLDLLASPAGLLAKPLLRADPTGETLRLVEELAAGSQPQREDGVWVAPSRPRALLLATTRAAGSDIDAQAAALTAIHAAFESARASLPAAYEARLLLTGPGVFAVQARSTIEREVTLLSAAGSALIVALLLLTYRSATLLALSLLPVASGILAGIAAVGLGFGVVHGVTLGFGTALIGEAVDYAIYYFVRAGRGEPLAAWWPTVRLGVATSICGFAALLASGFPGLAQLGLYAIAGLLAAVLVTRHVLPGLAPARLAQRDLAPVGRRLEAAIAVARRARLPVLALAVAAAAVLYQQRERLWHHELAALNPIGAAELALDASLRADLGAPDARHLVIVTAPDAEGALAAAEQAAAVLTPLVAEGRIGGFETPARFLPSQATQGARQAALPPREELAARLAAATAALPLKASKLDAFIDDVERARKGPLASRAEMEGSSLAQAVDALLMPVSGTGQWRALLPLRPAAAGTPAERLDETRVRAALAGVPGVLVIDLKAVSDRMYASYLDEAIRLALGGVAAIVLLLAIALRSLPRALRVCLPLALAVLLVTAALALAGQRLNLLHLVGMLLVVAVGSNYALFFDRLEATPDAATTLASLLLANLTAVAGFGVLAFSSVPVLHAIGVVVGPGAVLALGLAAVFSRGKAAGEGRA